MGNGQYSSPLSAQSATAAAAAAAAAALMDRKLLNQLISLSQSKLTFERDLDTSTCLRKAVLVQNCLRRTALYPIDDEDCMVISSTITSAKTASPAPAPLSISPSSSCSPCNRRPLYRGIPYGESTMMDEDDNEVAHVPEMLPRTMMAVDTIMAETQFVSQTVLEISPPPSPDALNQDTEEDAMDLTLQAEFLRRSALVRKSSACAVEETLSSSSIALSTSSSSASALVGEPGLLQQSPSKRPRLMYDNVVVSMAASPVFDAVH